MARPRATAERKKLMQSEKHERHYAREREAADKVGLEVTLLRLLRKVTNYEGGKLPTEKLNADEVKRCVRLEKGGYLKPHTVSLNRGTHRVTERVTHYSITQPGRSLVEDYLVQRSLTRDAHGSNTAMNHRKLKEAIAFVATVNLLRSNAVLLKKMRRMNEILQQHATPLLTKVEVQELLAAGFSIEETRKRVRRGTEMKKVMTPVPALLSEHTEKE